MRFIPKITSAMLFVLLLSVNHSSNASLHDLGVVYGFKKTTNTWSEPIDSVSLQIRPFKKSDEIPTLELKVGPSLLRSSQHPDVSVLPQSKLQLVKIKTLTAGLSLVEEECCKGLIKKFKKYLKSPGKIVDDVVDLPTKAIPAVLDPVLGSTKDIIDHSPVPVILNESGKVIGNVSRETFNVVSKTSKALEVAAEPKNLLKQALIYTGTVYGGPLGSAFANALCDKLIFGKNMTDDDFLRSIALGAASGYASEYVQGMEFNSNYAKRAASHIAKNLSRDLTSSAIYGNDYHFRDFITSVAEGSIEIDIESDYVNNIASQVLENVSSTAVADLIHEGKLDFNKLDSTIYTSMAEGITTEKLNEIFDQHISPLIPEEHRRLDLQAYESTKKVFIMIFKTTHELQKSVMFELENQTDDFMAFAQKPPFFATPLNQPLSYNSAVCNQIDINPTPGSKVPGGYPGKTRNGGQKMHWGIDEPSHHITYDDIVRYNGLYEGKVIASGYAINNLKEKKSLGYRVTIEFQDKQGNQWQSKTYHHKSGIVKVGDIVKPGDIIAIGSGVGDDFKSELAGEAHIHWEVKRNGKRVNPNSGKLLE